MQYPPGAKFLVDLMDSIFRHVNLLQLVLVEQCMAHSMVTKYYIFLVVRILSMRGLQLSGTALAWQAQDCEFNSQSKKRRILIILEMFIYIIQIAQNSDQQTLPTHLG